MKESKPILKAAGFTLIELLVYSVVFASISITLIYFLTTFFRVSGHQASTAEVAHQANFILQRIERGIADAAFVTVNDDGDDETDGTLSEPHAKLVIKSPSEIDGAPGDTASPIVIYRTASSTAVMKRGNQEEATLNGANVAVTKLLFTKVSTPPGKDVILIDLVLEYQSPDAAKRISRQFTLGVGKASAATFDTDVKPAATNAKDLGASGAKWKALFLSGNATIDGSMTLTTGGTNSTKNSINFMKQGVMGVNPPSVPAGGSIIVTMASSAVPYLAGIQTGDSIFMTPPTVLEDGLVFVGAEAANGAILIKIKNTTAAGINGLLRIWSYLVIR